LSAEGYTLKNKFLQQYLLEKSLDEFHLKCDIRINHQHGINNVNGIDFEVKYPRSYIKEIDLLSKEKIYNYCFIGFMGKLGRNSLLEKYSLDNQSIIKNSENGRDAELKYKFDKIYYQAISNSKYSLCPNHEGLWYLHERSWNYRFIESLFCKSIPIIFKKTPLGIDFLKDIFFLWDTDSHDMNQNEYTDLAEQNYKKAIKYWTFQSSEIELLKK
jgi:hypothetical protein